MIKYWHYLELLKPKFMKLLGSAEGKIAKVKNDDNVENIDVVLVYCNIANNKYQRDS